MLSHAEAQALVSARFDGPLDAVAERALNAHLATCTSCRAFNRSAGQLARNLQGLPYLPASPAVSRAVLEHVNAPRSPWSRLALPAASSVMPAFSAVAVALIVVFVGTFGVLRILDSDDPDPETLTAPTSNELAQSPSTATSTSTSTSTSELAAEGSTSVPAEPTATARTDQPGAGAVSTEAPAVAPTVVSTAASTEEPQTLDRPPTEPPASEGPTEEVTGRGAEPGTEPGATTTQPQPTAPATEVESGPTEQAMATATAVPTDEPTVTEVPTEEPTATEVPTEEPTATDVPMETLQPTEEQDAAGIPTEEQGDEPTATAVPTDEPTATEVPTEVPTETPEPTATEVPTDEPTATSEPTEEPTATEVPTEEQGEPTSPPIEPIDGTVVPAEEPITSEVVTEEPIATEEPPATENDGQNIVASVIPSTGQETATTEAEESNNESGDGDESPPIEQRDENTPDSGSDDDDSGSDDGNQGPPDDDGGDGDDGSGDGDGDDDGNGDAADDDSGVGGGTDEPIDEAQPAGEDTSLSDAEVYGDVASVPGDPGTRLGISAGGDLIFSTNPGRVPLEEDGLTLSAAPSDTGQSVFACNDAGACLDATSPSATGSHLDTPLGWLNGELIYERIDETANDPVSYRAVSFDPDTRVIAEDRVLDEGGREIESLRRPYPVDGGFLVLASGAWLFIDGESVQTRGDNPYGDAVQLIRLHPATGEISYVVGDNLMTASLESPGTPVSVIPFAGTDYALSPDGSQVVGVTGSELQVVGRDGRLIRSFRNPDGIAIGSVVWLDEGIVFVDLTTGALRLIPIGD